MTKRDELMTELRTKARTNTPMPSYFKTMLSTEKTTPVCDETHSLLFKCGYENLSNRAKDNMLNLDKTHIAKSIEQGEGISDYLSQRQSIISSLCEEAGYSFIENEIDTGIRKARECEVVALVSAYKSKCFSR